MAVRVRTSNGEAFVVYETLGDLTKQVRAALDNNQLFEVKNGDGRVRVVNPHQIVDFEEVDDPLAAPAP